jgi:hypothetical protein
MNPTTNRRERSLAATAHHEAGHAVVNWKCDPNLGAFTRMTIIPDEDNLGGYVQRRSESMLEEMDLKTAEGRSLMEKEAIVLFAGRIAESKYRGYTVRSGYEKDYEFIDELCSDVCKGNRKLEVAWKKLMRLWAEWYVGDFWTEIQAVAKRLQEKKTLELEEFETVMVAAFHEEMKLRREKGDALREKILAEGRRTPRSTP